MKAPLPEDARAWRDFIRRGMRLALFAAESQKSALYGRWDRARAVLKARLALGKDPAFAPALAGLDRLRDKPAEEQLKYLGAAIQGLPLDKSVRDAVNRERPPRGDEVLLKGMRHQLAERLPALLRRELEGTREGGRVLELFAGEELKAGIEWLDCLAAFDSNGNISFGEDLVEGWMRVEGLTAKGLLGDPGAQARLASMLAPHFVHEATHLRQREAFRRAGLVEVPSQEHEIEALAASALFALEKSSRDPGYLDRLHPSSRHNALLLRRDPEGFKNAARNWYADLPSLDFEFASQLLSPGDLTPEKAFPRAALSSRGLRGSLPAEPERLRAYLAGWRREMGAWARGAWERVLRGLRPGP
jgi:hypothetical protein